jgi:hypothetical protein
MKNARPAYAALSSVLAIAAAAPAGAGVTSITMDSLYAPSGTWAGTFTNSASYVSAWNTVSAGQPTPDSGYGDQSIYNWNGSQSNAVFGADTNLAFHDQVVFTAAETGTYNFRFGIDFGLGGTLLLNGTSLATNTNNMWWNYNYSDATQYLAGSANLTAGKTYTIDLYGFEDCCDGGTQGQFQAPDASFQNFSVPEPFAWALMLTGFAGIGAALRTSRRRVAVG